MPCERDCSAADTASAAGECSAPTSTAGDVVHSSVDALLTPEDAAKRLKVTAEQIRSLIRKRQLPAINVGTGKKRPLYRITAAALEEFLSSRCQFASQGSTRRLRRPPPVRDHFPNLR